jgi:hypothetical protein
LGLHFTGNLNEIEVKQYSIELSSLSPWTCARPSKITMAEDDGKCVGFDESWRFPTTIEAALPDKDFDLHIKHSMKMDSAACSSTTTWNASVSILAHDTLKLSAAAVLAWQAKNLLSLLVGDGLYIRSASMELADTAGGSAMSGHAKILFKQTGRQDSPDVHAAMMILPYDLVKDKFATIVQKWFSRHQQAVLATDVYFASEYLRSATVNVRFIVLVQALESYHRSLGTGMYMDQGAFDEAIREFSTHLPACLQGSHRDSIKSRLKYGNEYSLRKRLHEMLARLPDDVRSRVAGGDAGRFVSRIADTRNYYTHYDHEGEGNCLEPKDVFVATERLRILFVANQLVDLGIPNKQLLTFLERSEDFKYRMGQELAL